MVNFCKHCYTSSGLCMWQPEMAQVMSTVLKFHAARITTVLDKIIGFWQNLGRTGSLEVMYFHPPLKTHWLRSCWLRSSLADFEYLRMETSSSVGSLHCEDFFLSSYQKFLCCNLCALPLVQSLCTSGSILLYLTTRSGKTLEGSLHSLLFWRLIKPSTSLHDMSSLPWHLDGLLLDSA